MTSSVVTPSRLLGACAAGCCLLWLSIVSGGAVNDGYSHTRDFVSALSSRGASHAWIGMTGLAGFAAAHLAAGQLGYRRSKELGGLLTAAGVSGLVVSLARINCPDGAGHCLNDGVADDLLDHVHGFSVAAYEGFFVLGLLAAAGYLARDPRESPRWLAPSALTALAAASVGTVLSIPDASPGAMQRVWLAINTVGVLAVATQFARRARSASAAATR